MSSVRIALLTSFFVVLGASSGFSATSDLFVASNSTNTVVRVDGITGASLGTFATGISGPRGVAFDTSLNLYVAATGSSSVWRFDPTGASLGEFVTPGSGGISSLADVKFGPDGNFYVASKANSSIARFDGTTGAFIDDFATSATLTPNGFQFRPDGNLYVVDQDDARIERFNGTTGAFIDVFASGGLSSPYGLTFGPGGDLYVSNQTNANIIRYDGATGASLGVFATGLSNGLGITFGPDGHLYVASHFDDVVKRFDGTTGSFIDDFASVAGPIGITFVAPPPAVPALSPFGLGMVSTLMAGVICVMRRRSNS